MKCPVYDCLIYEMTFLWNVLSMKCPVYAMSCLWNVFLRKRLTSDPLLKVLQGEGHKGWAKPSYTIKKHLFYLKFYLKRGGGPRLCAPPPQLRPWLKYPKFTSTGCKARGISKLEYEANDQFLYLYINLACLSVCLFVGLFVCIQ